MYITRAKKGLALVHSKN